MAEMNEQETIQVLEELPMPPEIRDDMQKLVAMAGGAVWGRTDQLDARTRSLSTMSILTALGRHDELAIHIRLGQEQFGVTRTEICEMMMHAAVYAGFPAAISAMRVATRVFDEMDA